MTIILSPEKRAFIQREIAAGGFSSETDAVERALTVFERHLRRAREAIDVATREIADGKGITLNAEQHLAQIRANAPKDC